MTFSLTSPVFRHEEPIPARYTCDGLDVSPPLVWRGIPEGARSLALVLSDPDAPDPAHPRTTWTHWILYDLPAVDAALPERAGPLPPGTRDGLNDWKKTGYGGPCPPVGTHRYYFELHALDRSLGDLHDPTRAQLLDAMRGHVITTATLMGTYGPRGKRRW